MWHYICLAFIDDNQWNRIYSCDILYITCVYDIFLFGLFYVTMFYGHFVYKVTITVISLSNQ